MTIRIEVQPNEAGQFTVRTRDGDNGNVLLSSTRQGYANKSFAVDIARRHFPEVSEQTRQLMAIDGSGEPVWLDVLSADGTVIESEQLR